jgi:hypothetical protein
MGEDPAGARQHIRTGGRDPLAGGLLLGLDRAGLGQRRCGELVPCGAGGRVDAVDRVRQVDRGRAGGAQERAGPLERFTGGLAQQLERDPVGSRYSNQRRAADREPADCAGDGRRAIELEFALLPGERGLVERPQCAPIKAQGNQGARLRLASGCSHPSVA